jgi:hypothetical protein
VWGGESAAAIFATPADAPNLTTLLLTRASCRAAGHGASEMTVDEKKEPEPPPFLNTVEAAAWLRLTKNTLEKMRVQGRGPIYRKHGRYVRYHIEDLVDYSQGSKRRSTSDAD